jgi:RimJ/RimL family protein N-acetyltransferase
MTSYPRVARLRGGEEVTLRPVEKSDEQALVDFFAALPQDDRMFLQEDVTDRSVIKCWMDNIDLSRVFPLLALVNGKIVGDATLHGNSHGWSKHVGAIRVVVARDWQRKGVAQALVRDLVALANERGIEILEALVLEGQHGAQRAMEALGFQVETVLRRRATDRTGRRRNVLIMTNDVSELWKRMEDLMADLELRGSGHY